MIRYRKHLIGGVVMISYAKQPMGGIVINDQL